LSQSIIMLSLLPNSRVRSSSLHKIIKKKWDMAKVIWELSITLVISIYYSRSSIVVLFTPSSD
jgi:hypothetical protein